MECHLLGMTSVELKVIVGNIIDLRIISDNLVL